MRSHAVTALVGLAVGAGGAALALGGPDVAGLSSAQSAMLVNELSHFEGWRSCSYQDELGYPTIGYGTLLPLSEAEQDSLGLPPSPDCIDQTQGRWLLVHRVNGAAVAFEGQWSSFFAQGRHVQVALLDAAYQLGADGLLGFKAALPALAHGDCDAAVHGFEASKWDHETPARVDHLIHAIREDCG